MPDLTSDSTPIPTTDDTTSTPDTAPTKSTGPKLDEVLACIKSAFGPKCQRILNREAAIAVATKALTELYGN